MSTEKKHPKLDTIRALLAKAEDPATTEAEAELARKRAFEMMAKYGVEQALLNDGQPSEDAITSRYVKLPNPWSMSRMRLMYLVAEALGCKAIYLRERREGGTRVLHVFGYESDIQRAEVLYASLVLQMFGGLAAQPVPYDVRSARAWRNSWQLGFIERVIARLREIEKAARTAAEAETSATGRGGALVLADRDTQVRAAFRREHGRVQKTRGTYTGSGYGEGAAAGNRADIGGTRIGGTTAGALAS
ncbi:DUF2786 domain-containing protein [Streptomyces sp. NPDC057654]|uniref:DUF2786 domain-containing protein n=1 Tax=Streptomyces sp. NPDC057654 TaxID=3346196 RepID=UPI003676318C